MKQEEINRYEEARKRGITVGSVVFVAGLMVRAKVTKIDNTILTMEDVETGGTIVAAMQHVTPVPF